MNQLSQASETSPDSEMRPASPREASAASVMLGALARRGVRAVFGIPGGLVSPFYDALADVPSIQLVTTRHEGMAGFAAMGHALATGVPAVVLTTSGPGLTNAITGIAAAHLEGLPLIVIAGEVATGAMSRGAMQDASSNALDAVAMMRTVCRWSARMGSPDDASGIIEQAFRVATGPRPGPVFISVPLDVGAAAARTTPMHLVAPRESCDPDPAACVEAAQRLVGARRPLLVVGNGARAAWRELLALAERVACPVVTTPHAKGIFPDSHPLYLGGIGLGGHPSAAAYLAAGPDVVCVVGSRLNDYATNGWSLSLAGTEATIQIDRQPWLVGRNCLVTLGIVADARLALAGMLAALPSEVARPRRVRVELTRSQAADMTSDALPLRPGRVMAGLQAAFPGAIWAVDQGEHCAYALHYLSVDDPEGFQTMVGLASMGSGIGVAIGMRHAQRMRPVVGICGDGGFAMHAGELLTCVEHGIDVVLAVINDGRWNMVHHGFQKVFGRRPRGLPSHVADLAGVAREFGAVGLRVETPADLDAARLREAASRGRPVLLDIRIDPGLALSADSRSAALQDHARKEGAL
jgi:acetolactate synthase I/II/III large subunit